MDYRNMHLSSSSSEDLIKRPQLSLQLFPIEKSICNIFKANRLEPFYNPNHNILRLYNVLVQVRLTANKMKIGI